MSQQTRVYAPVKPARSYEEQVRRISSVHILEIGDEARA